MTALPSTINVSNTLTAQRSFTTQETYTLVQATRAGSALTGDDLPWQQDDILQVSIVEPWSTDGTAKTTTMLLVVDDATNQTLPKVSLVVRQQPNRNTVTLSRPAGGRAGDVGWGGVILIPNAAITP